MKKLDLDDLMNFEDYVRQRKDFRRQIMAHKTTRRVPLGTHLSLYFEDRLTMLYQVQEMMRIEQIFETEAIQEELNAYNSLIPDGQNWKATCMLEYDDEQERHDALVLLKGFEHQIWVQVGNTEKTFGIADEGLERNYEEKTSAVHFMRFELTADAIQGVHSGAPITFGSDHCEYLKQHTLESATYQALLRDLVLH